MRPFGKNAILALGATTEGPVLSLSQGSTPPFPAATLPAVQASPLRTHRKPGYPTRLEIESDPALLRRHFPTAWAARPELTAASALLLSCAIPGCNTAPQAAPRNQAEDATVPSAHPGVRVAPLFEHGEGRGAFGCIVVSPPAYLSEDEAWTIIDAELSRHGIRLTERERSVSGIEIPLYDRVTLESLNEGDPLPEPTSLAPLSIDRADPTRRISLEFVSADNPPEKSSTWTMGSVGGIELKGEADALRTMISTEATEPVFFGALYDPACSPDLENTSIPPLPDNPSEADWEKHWDQINAPAKAKSKRFLRQQVRDFIHWLQAQGAI